METAFLILLNALECVAVREYLEHKSYGRICTANYRLALVQL
jgi:hypothetical protein